MTVKDELQPEALCPQSPPETKLPPGATAGGCLVSHLHGIISAQPRPHSGRVARGEHGAESASQRELLRSGRAPERFQEG